MVDYGVGWYEVRVFGRCDGDEFCLWGRQDAGGHEVRELDHSDIASVPCTVDARGGECAKLDEIRLWFMKDFLRCTS